MILVGFNPAAIFLSIFPFIGLLLAIVLIHEFGHFIAAKAFGIKVLEFGVGFPPRVKGLVWTHGETEYTVNWLPIGGFVRLLGEEDPTDPRSLAAAARWKRLTVMFAGVFMNFVLAIVLVTVGYMIPRERALNLAQVTEVAPGSPASMAEITGKMRDNTDAKQGLQLGDIVKNVDGRDIKNTTELVFANRLDLGNTQTWIIQRQGATLTAKVFARWKPPAGQGPTGIKIGSPSTCSGVDDKGNPTNCTYLYPYTETVQYPPWEALPKGIGELRDTMVFTINMIHVKIAGSSGAAVSDDQPTFQGPVGIASTTGDIIQQDGWRPLIELAALISLNLGIFNALPLPMLDGGRIFFVLLEILRGGRRIAPEKENLVHLTGFALMMMGVLVVTYFDIARIVT